MSAAIAVFVGTTWAYQYISSTSWAARSLVDYINGNEYYNLNEATTGVLLIVIIRFILGFGFTWAPLKLVGALVARNRSGGETTSDGDN